MDLRIPVDRAQIEDFCRRNHIRRPAFFGSVLRDDFGPESDVDVLVELEPGRTMGFEFFELREQLSQIFGRRVELTTFDGIRDAYRQRIISSARDFYVAA